ncbi:Hypothetical predicted protein [Paramuricea clavata]|uniref:Uncharacterized protein n=1 Tax=Paramuricea clavata TaxID=317549 RepID=A0A6S7IWB5_PARCT|nr:Hypothetical predicted protein [Paramuricea clavata]
MAASFKIPTSLKRKAKKDPELPKFEWKLFEKENKLGCDEFDFASFADFMPTCAKDVVEDGSNVVEATAEAEGSTLTLTDIQWDKQSVFQELYILRFEVDGGYYTISASDQSVTASQGTDGGTIFHRFRLSSPNKPYFVLKSTTGDDLYLSSDGAGKMKLKSWNLPEGRSPPGASGKIDPAFLFRLVRPS